MSEKVKIPEGYMEDQQGRLVPVDSVKEVDKFRDETVREMIEKARVASAALTKFKKQAVADFNAYLETVAERYGAASRGIKGNVILRSYDGRLSVSRTMAENIQFDERLQVAKALIDDCLLEWSKDARVEVKTIIMDAFQVDKRGRLNTRRILELKRLKITGEKWEQAMTAISDAIMVTGTIEYFRFHETGEDGRERQIQLDFAGV